MTILTVVILTYDEAKHITRALQSLEGLDAQVFVVDSFSKDQTVALAQAHGAQVVHHAFASQAQQFDWAMETLPIDTPWVMRLDADEVLTPELVRELRTCLDQLPADVTGINLKRRHIFLGRWIRHGGRYPITLLRIWRKGAARIEQRWMDEHMVLLHGRSITCRHDFLDHNLNDVSHLITKHNAYATREAIDVLSARYDLGATTRETAPGQAPSQAARKRWIKENLYNRLPFWCGPLGYFLFRFTVQRGFLDGQEGVIYHVLQGFWYRFLVGSKIVEYDRVLAAQADAGARLHELERLTGYRLR